MSEQQNPQTPAVPVALEPPAEPKRTAAADLPPEALKARLDQAKETARRELLAEMGVADTKDVKAALADLKARQDSEKTELERAKARVAELETKAAHADEAAKIAANRAALEMASLTDAQRSYVTQVAGDNPLQQLRTLDALKASGMIERPAAPAAVATVATPAPAPNTAPLPNAPQPGSNVSEADPRKVFETLQATNPFAAAAYAQRNQHRLIPSQ